MSQEEKRVEQCRGHLEQLDESVFAQARLPEALPDLPHDLLRRVRHCGRRLDPGIRNPRMLRGGRTGGDGGRGGGGGHELEEKSSVSERGVGQLGSWGRRFQPVEPWRCPYGAIACDTYKRQNSLKCLAFKHLTCSIALFFLNRCAIVIGQLNYIFFSKIFCKMWILSSK